MALICRTVFAALASIAVAESVRASTLYIEYLPGPWPAITDPTQVWTPIAWGWIPVNGGGVPVVNAGNAQVNAWRVTDASSGTPNPRYRTDLIPSASTTSLNQGWKYTAYARYVTEGVQNNAGGPSLGLSVHLGNRVYHLMLDLTPAGDLQASLFDDLPNPPFLTHRVHRLTSGGVTATDFHRFELSYAPSTQLVTFLFDGVLKDQWNGVPLAHPNFIEWGNSDQAGAGRGVMEFNDIRFELGPFTALIGDYDGNGTVSSSDYALWKSSFRSQTSLAADGNEDRVVNAADYTVWRDRRASSAAATVAIAEPGSGYLSLLAVILPLSFRATMISIRYKGRTAVARRTRPARPPSFDR